ncbi:MAG: 3-5 exonuclease [Betaproteobacteria bacterium]|nr:3-5 exonuclease [Betaproteobacteria bacterium]
MSRATQSALSNPIPCSISKEDLANLPIRRYGGDVRMVATAQDLEQALEDISHENVVGLDTETRPSFKKGESYLPCLVQVATARAAYLFQLSQVDAFPIVTELLEASRIVKAGVALAHDLRSLKAVFPFEEKNVLDLGLIARGYGLSQTGLRNLAGIFLGIRIPKGNRTSNWAARRLSDAQITYAATDAWVCRELFLRFETLGLLAAPRSGRADSDPASSV